MFERYSERARRLIFLSLWSARRRGGSYIEPEDLLHALIREDGGEFAAIRAEISPGSSAPNEGSAGNRRPFFDDSVATNLLRELHEDTEPRSAETRGEKREPVDMSISHSLKKVLALVAKAHQDDTKATAAAGEWWLEGRTGSERWPQRFVFRMHWYRSDGGFGPGC